MGGIGNEPGQSRDEEGEDGDIVEICARGGRRDARERQVECTAGHLVTSEDTSGAAMTGMTW